MTLLEIVQDILSDMDSDNVNSISDTVEAQQVAQIIKTTYREIIDSREWPHLKKIVQIDSVSSGSYPTHMILDEDIRYVNWIKYDKALATDTRKKYIDIQYLEPKDFLDEIMGRNEDNSNVDSITDYGGTYLLIVNDEHPTYWTSFDDEHIVFDSYNSDVDSTITTAKNQAEVYQETSWTHTDGAYPNLPEKAFSYLLSESKSVCFEKLKQVANAKEEQRSRRQRTYLAREKWRTNGGIKYPNYGRTGKK